MTDEIGRDQVEELIRHRQSEHLEQSRRSYDNAPEPKGLGGWLVLPIIGLFVTIIGSAVVMFRDIIPLMDSDTWSLFTAPGMHPLWVPFFMFEVFSAVVLFLAPIALLILLFRKRRVLPKLIIWFYGLAFIILVVESVVILVFGADMLPEVGLREEAGWTTASIAADLVRGVIPTAIWIPYFLFSVRVKNTFLNPPIHEPLRQTGQRPPETSPTLASRVAAGSSPLKNAEDTTSPTSQVPPKRPAHRSLMWLLGTFLVVVLIAVGVLAWRSVTLSDEVSSLSDALTKATSTTTTRSTTTTTLDPWRGGQTTYAQGWQAVISARSDLIAKDEQVPGNLATTHAKAIMEDIVDLALQVNRLPYSPRAVQEAQDDYFNALMNLHAAAKAVRWNDSRSNVDAYNNAWSEEFKLLQVWLREYGRASQVQTPTW